MHPWDRPQLFVWMGIDTPEVREVALREEGLSRRGAVYLRICFRACPVCGCMTHTQSADPWHPAEGSTVADASLDTEDLAVRYRDRVRIEIVPPDPWDIDKDVCKSCKDAWQRAPEVMNTVRNLIRMAAYERDQAERARQAEAAAERERAEMERLLAGPHRPSQEDA